MAETMNEWTEGPWTVKPGDSVLYVKSGDDLIAIVGDNSYWSKFDRIDGANARLIAAAPDLYAALEYMADLFKGLAGDQSTDDGWKNEELRDVWLQARAALAKSRGDQQGERK